MYACMSFYDGTVRKGERERTCDKVNPVFLVETDDVIIRIYDNVPSVS